MVALVVICALTFLFVFVTAISFAPISHGFVRTFAFPRVQFLVLATFLLVATLWLTDGGWRIGLVVVQAVTALVQIVSIAQFTPLRTRQTGDFRHDPDGPSTISVMSCNVKMSNREYGRALTLTRDADPDIALFMEVDSDWVEALKPLTQHWPQTVLRPLENSYGMALFSRLELQNVDVAYLTMDKVPSFHATVLLRDGQRFRIHCVHPEPPVPYADSAGRDSELMLVAERVRNDPLPSIVCGDLNDVAWSHTTRLFQRLSGLLDPRVGRGFFNTFDARYWFLRWPLDHLFHDRRFGVISIKRLEAIGSDHFPIYFKLGLDAAKQKAQIAPEETSSDRQEARSIHADAEELERPAIGSDWEK